MPTNRSYETDGTDNPTKVWMQKIVRVKQHPQWGEARVMRWYPAGGGFPPRLRLMCTGINAPQIVCITDVEIVKDAPCQQ